jgi:transposase InsO family protein
MLGGADNPNGELPSYITGADTGDRVNRQFVAERPDQLWVADFTYGVPGVQ